MKPIHVLADSQLLFWRNGEALARIASSAAAAPLAAAYIGASNGDRPEFYTIFEGAMDVLGIGNRRMIPSSRSANDDLFLMQADVILLAGGDVQKGWQVFERTGLKELLIRRYHEGAWLIGVSAGAVQLGLMGWTANGSPDFIETFHTCALIPYVIGAHDEKNEWAELKRVVGGASGFVRGLGLPTGGGAVYHANRTLEPIRYPLYEIVSTDVRAAADERPH